MKKKGLIISTVVMVVVLIAALTTTTFAWFSTTASAKIDNLNVQTKASEGLEIALFDIATPTSYSSGEATFAADKWTGASQTWGSTVGFSANTAEEGGKEYLGVSGDGVDMYTIPQDANVTDKGTAPDGTTVSEAKANENYFMAYIALSNTTGKAQKIFIDGITIKPTAASDEDATLNGMAASLRIAIFVIEGDSVTDEGFTEATCKFAYNPYENIKYNASRNEWETASPKADEKCLYKEDFSTSATFSEMTTAGKQFSTHTGYLAAKTDFSSVSDPSKLPEINDTFTSSDSCVLAANNDGTSIVRLKVVVWFEGQDAECINHFAGGGAEISLSFNQEAVGD